MSSALDYRSDVPTPEIEEATSATTPIMADEFSSSYEEPLARALDIDTWQVGADVAALYDRLEFEIADAVHRERDLERQVRETVFPRLRDRPNALPEAGVRQATPAEIRLVHQQQLFPGNVEACDGTSVMHDTLPVTIVQLGVCLASYQGDLGT